MAFLNLHQRVERSSDVRDAWGSTRRTLAFGKCVLASVAILVMWYTLSSWAGHFYGRYFSPLFLPFTVMMGIVIADVYFRRPLRSDGLLVCFRRPLLFAGLLVCFSSPLIVSLAALQMGKGYAGNTMYSQQLPLVRRHVPEEAYVAAAQSGTLGYFRSRVVNLDGKVNAEALRFQNNMWLYLQHREIPWFCDWPSCVRKYLGSDPEAIGWHRVEQEGDFVLYHYANATPGTASGRQQRVSRMRSDLSFATTFVEAVPAVCGLEIDEE
jgi:hypothetical protein